MTPRPPRLSFAAQAQAERLSPERVARLEAELAEETRRCAELRREGEETRGEALLGQQWLDDLDGAVQRVAALEVALGEERAERVRPPPLPPAPTPPDSTP